MLCENADGIATLANALEQNGGVLEADVRGIRQSGLCRPEYLLYRAPKNAVLQLHNAIILFNGKTKDISFSRSANLIAVLFSGEQDYFALPEESFSQCIRCGMRPQDDLCLASHGEGRSILSVENALHLLTGETLTPGDFRMEHPAGMPAHSILQAAACLLLTRQFADGVIYI